MVHQKRGNAASPALGVQQAGSLSIVVGQELYRTILFAVFLLQIMVGRCIPFGIGTHPNLYALSSHHKITPYNWSIT